MTCLRLGAGGRPCIPVGRDCPLDADIVPHVIGMPIETLATPLLSDPFFTLLKT